MNGWGIFAIILILILLGLAITFLVLWLVKKEKSADAKKELAINGLKVAFTNGSTPAPGSGTNSGNIPIAPLPTPSPMSTSAPAFIPTTSPAFIPVSPTPTPTPISGARITATWSSVGNPADRVTLFADTKKINFDADGVPTTTSSTLLKSETVAGGTRTVSVAGVAPNTKYFVDVVVTNPNLKGSVNIEPFTLFAGNIPSGEFSISEFDATGAIVLSADNQTVNYVADLNKNSDDLWRYDASKFTLTGNGLAGQGDPILYNNGGVLAADLPSSSSITTANSQWIYDSQNKWCLRSNPALCMSIDLPVPTSTQVKLVNNSKSQWKNKGV